MKLLLDTHTLLWWLSDDPKLGTAARDRIMDPANDILVSVASRWEILVKGHAGKLEPGIDEILHEMQAQGFALLQVAPAHLAALAGPADAPPRPLQSPADRPGHHGKGHLPVGGWLRPALPGGLPILFRHALRFDAALSACITRVLTSGNPNPRRKLQVTAVRGRPRKLKPTAAGATTAADDPPRLKRATATGKALNAANLETLGAARLAELLMAVSKGSAAAQRQLRLALAGSGGADGTARAVTKQLVRIGQAKTWLNWQKIKPLLAELEVQRRAILDVVAPADPGEAFELLWRLVGCAEGVLARSDDGSGRLAEAFHAAAEDLGPLAQRAALPPEVLANRAFQALVADAHGIWDRLVPTLAPQLGTTGLLLVRDAVQEWQAEPVPTPPGGKRPAIRRSSTGSIHAGERQSRHRAQTASFVLQQVADALGDVDGFIAQFDASARRMPAAAAAIARRLLAAGRLPEAWAAVEQVEARRHHDAPVEWQEVRAEVLEALGRSEEAQAFRWACFAATLQAIHLCAFLRRLPDFDDVEAEQRAMALALAFADVHQSLAFLIAWPDLQRASTLVLSRTQALDGDRYELLSPAAEALEGRYPLAATILRRAMIGFTLRTSRSSRYKHAAKHLRACRDTAMQVESFGAVPDHPAYERTLRTAHGRKTAFWQEVAKLG